MMRSISIKPDQDESGRADIMGRDTEGGWLSKFGRGVLYTLSFLVALIPISWFFILKTFDQYERAVVFRLGKLVTPVKGPGLFFFLPFVDRWRKVDLRTKTLDVPSQDMMTKDSVTVKVNAVVYFHVHDAIKSVVNVQNHKAATALLAQTTLRSVIGESELDDLLQRREKINQRLLEILDAATDEWGVKVTVVEVKDVNLPASMQRSMASQAEAERERRAKVISADGEYQAASTLLEAADLMTKNSATMQLRYLQTLTAISVEKNSTIVFPLPMELFNGFIQNRPACETGNQQPNLGRAIDTSLVTSLVSATQKNDNKSGGNLSDLV